MDTRQKIQSIICGNPKSNAGYEPLYLLNNPTFRPMPNMGYPGMRDNDHFYAVKVFPDITVYTLVHSKDVRSFGAGREGMLKIGIGIPKGMRVAGGVSPREVLDALHDTFLKTNTTRDGQETYFNMQMAPAGVMEETLNKYALEPCSCPYRVMRGTAAAYAAVKDVGALMLDVAYPELEGYGELVVGEKVSGNLPVVNLAVPRRRAFRLVVEGKPQPWSVLDPVHQRSAVAVNGTVVEFSIEEIRNQGGKKWFADAQAWVEADENLEEISVCAVQPPQPAPPAAMAASPSAQPQNNSNLAWLWIALGALCVALCIAAVIIFWLR